MSNSTGQLDPTPDQIDAALESFWHGSCMELDQLIRSADGEGPAIGSALSWVIESHWSSLVESYVIPGYQLLREIGRGGMGIVFEAIQQSTGRNVALKLVPGFGMTRERQAHYLRREVQTLSLLRHDGIATLFDAGQTADKCQYFAMELVKGKPLSRQFPPSPPADAAGLRRRLDLALDVCNAVAYAHRRGVIHCDLKPSNVLVDENGRAKVMDFGLARLLEIDPTATLSLAGPALLGTLAYMSPEQAAGRATDVDVRSDVYAIGVMLYELLTGRRPYDLTDLRFPQAIKRICEFQPRPPSDQCAMLRGDLDTIVLVALAKEPARRYQGVDALAADLQRYLDRRPIEARPASIPYVVAKWCSRHRLSAGLIAALVVLLSTFAAVEIRQAYQLAAQRDEARQQARKAEQASAFLQSIFGTLDPNLTGSDVSVLSVLDDAAARVDAVLSDNSQARAELHGTFGHGYYTLARYKPAEVEFEKASAEWRALAGEMDARYAASLHMSGLAALKASGPEVAGARLRRARAIREELFKGDHVDIAESLYGLGLFNQYVDFPAAEDFFRQSLDMRRRLLGDHALVAQSLDALGRMLNNAGRLEEGEPLLIQALEMRRRLLGPDANEVGVTLGLLADIHYLNGSIEQAATEYAEQIRIFTKSFGEKGGDPLAHALSDLAGAYAELGRFAEAEDYHRKAIAMETSVSADGSAVLTQHNFASFLRSLGRYDEAEKLAREVFASWGTVKGNKPHTGVPYSSQSLGFILLETGRVDEAVPLLERADEVWRQLLGERSTKRSTSLMGLGRAAAEKDNPQEAVKRLKLALDLMEQSPGATHPETAQTRMILGRVKCELAELDEGHQLIQAGYEAIRASSQAGWMVKHRARICFAESLKERGHAGTAEALFDEALANDTQLKLDRHPLRADALLGKAEIRFAVGDIAVARRLIDDAMAIYRFRHCLDRRRTQRTGALTARLAASPGAMSTMSN